MRSDRAAGHGAIAISVEDMHKSYGDVRALDGVSIDVAAGSVFALLGPNGAGKTTLVRILTTLLEPDAGRGTVAGYDVVSQRTELRNIIGLAGQFAAVDEHLTGRENLKMVGRLYHLDAAIARRRAGELLERFSIDGAADRRVKTYSGGMRRRLDLAASLVAEPEVLFLDEPSTGLDPRGRNELWTVIREIARAGTTVLLTTQYLDEADQLADRIAVIDLGRLIAEGTAEHLKRQTGGEVLTVTVAENQLTDTVASVLGRHADERPQVDAEVGRVSISVTNGAGSLATIVRELDATGVSISGIELREPSLDEVFLALTGHAAQPTPAGDQTDPR